SYLARPRSTRKAPSPIPALFEIPLSLSLNDITAAACLGWVPAAAVGTVAVERTPSPPLEAPADIAPPRGAAQPNVPSYLSGRYGDDAKVVKLCVDQQRTVSCGSLIFRNSDYRQLDKAIGVVLRHDE